MKDLAGKTVLITGPTGFIGARLVRRLQRRDDIRVVALSGVATPLVARTVHVGERLEHLTRDTWRAAGVGSLDVVFHLAAFVSKAAGEANRLEAIYTCNLEGTRVLLDSLPTPPDRIVFASTVDVYAPAETALDERSPVGPSGLYGASKLFGEQNVREYARRIGSSHAILRYGNVYGPGEERYGKLIPNTIRRLLNQEAPVLYGDGRDLRDLLYVDDAVEATLRAAVCDAALLDPLNVVRGESVSVRKVVEQLVSLTGFSGKPRTLADARTRRSLHFDARRMQEALGTWDFVPLDEGLRREVEHFRALGTRT